MHFVSTCSNPFEIFRSIVMLISVNVINKITSGLSRNKILGYNAMYWKLTYDIVFDRETLK